MSKENLLRANISNEEVSALPSIFFDGEIVVVDDEQGVRTACAELSGEKLIGFDTETRPSFKAGVSYKVSLLQLSTHKRCFLFRLNKTGFTQEIKELLEDKNIVKIGADVSGDIRSLRQLDDFQDGGFYDLQNSVWEWGIEEKSLRKMVAIILSKKLSKAQRLSNWEAQQFTEQQKQYAAADAWVSIVLLEELEKHPKLSKQQRDAILAEKARLAAESAARKEEKAAAREKYRRQKSKQNKQSKNKKTEIK